MAADSRSKRASILGVGALAALALPEPDGVIALADRQHVAFLYAGVVAEEAAAPGDFGRRYTIRLASEARGINLRSSSRGMAV